MNIKCKYGANWQPHLCQVMVSREGGGVEQRGGRREREGKKGQQKEVEGMEERIGREEVEERKEGKINM